MQFWLREDKLNLREEFETSYSDLLSVIARIGICSILRSSKIFEIYIADSQPSFNPLSANPTKWPNTLRQFVGKLPTNYLSVFGHSVNLALKGLTVLCFKWSAKKHCIAKILQGTERDFYITLILTMFPTSLVTNSLSSLFCTFIETKNKNQIFSKLVVW